MRLPRRQHEGDVVASVRSQTAQAAQLSDIAAQQLLADPRTNPAVRQQHDQLRDEQQRRALTLEHRRALRRGRVADARASHAERALEALQEARETQSPARAVLELATTRKRYLAGCLAASVLLSIGSGMAIEAWLQERPNGAPTGLGYIVEAGLTILSTAMILLRGRLAARDTEVSPRHSAGLWTLIAVPLTASVALSTAGAGPVGAACSLGAAAWALAAYLAAQTLSSAITDAQAEVEAADEAELRAVALGEAFGTPSPDSGEKRLHSAATHNEPLPPASGWVSVPDGARCLPIVARTKTTPASASGKPRRSTAGQRKHTGSEEGPNGAEKSAAKPRVDKGTPLPKSLKSTSKSASEKSARALSDAELADLLETAIADSRLSAEPSVSAVQKCLSIGFDRAKRVLALRTETTVPDHLTAVPATREETAA